MKLYLLNNPVLVSKLAWLELTIQAKTSHWLAVNLKKSDLDELKTWASDMVTWYWLLWSIDHNMDFQYLLCTIKPRLWLGFRWSMAAMFHWVDINGSMCTWSMPLTMLAMKKELYGFLFLCMHMVVSIVMELWFVTANRALLKNNNILTWLQGFQVKIENPLMGSCKSSLEL